MSGPELKPCPFCGGEAVRQTLPSDEFGNHGGDVIECERCLASSHVEFGRKENLVSAWNRRAPVDYAALPEVQALITQLRDRAEKAEVEADFFKSEIKLRNKILDLGCVQALITEAYEAAAQSVEGDLSEFDHPSINYTFGRLADKIRALTPAAAIAARDAMIAEAAAKEREACAESAASSTVPSQTAMRLSAAIRKRGDV